MNYKKIVRGLIKIIRSYERRDKHLVPKITALKNNACYHDYHNGWDFCCRSKNKLAVGEK
jgi:hypothetical protein